MIQPQTTTSALHELGYKIFLDRYAQKDMTRASLTVGDTVIVVVNAKTGQREIGTVTAIDLPDVTVRLLDDEIVAFAISNMWINRSKSNPGQMMDRVARGVAATESGEAKSRTNGRRNSAGCLMTGSSCPAGAS